MKKKCNICNKKFIDKLSLGKHPCADTFLKNKFNAQKLKRYPLIVGFCECSHMTSIYPVPKYIRYEKYDYSYTSDNSVVSRTHFREIAKYISKNYKLDKKHFVVEAGSNDGTFLKEIYNFSKAKILGVDPSKNITNISRRKKIETFTNYFNRKTSKIILKKKGNADVIYGANVFNHVDDIGDFLEGVEILLKKKGHLILEVPDLNSLIEKVGFDTIYHEHRHYFSEKSICKVLKKYNLFVYKIQKINYMSGSLRVFASNVNKFNNFKNPRKVTLNQFRSFKKKAFLTIKKVKDFLKKHKSTIGVGAATKGNTLLNCCDVTDKELKFIVDKSKHKINKFTPGTGIKIIKETRYINADSALILPWNITKFLIKKKFFKKIKYTSIPKIIKSVK